MRVGGEDEHLRFEGEGVEVRGWRGAGCWSRLRDGVKSGIEGMSCTDDAVSIEESTMVDDGDDEGLPLSTLGMLGCDVDSCCPRKLSNGRKGGDREAHCRFEEKSEEGHERRDGWYWWRSCTGAGSGRYGGCSNDHRPSRHSWKVSEEG